MFMTHNIANEGRRGRPSHPKERELMRERILNAKGSELGILELEAQKDGSVLLSVEVDGSVKTLSFPAKRTRVAKGKRVAKARKARAKQ